MSDDNDPPPAKRAHMEGREFYENEMAEQSSDIEYCGESLIETDFSSTHITENVIETNNERVFENNYVSKVLNSESILESLKCIAQCSICRDIPSSIELFECSWGHIICGPCLYRLLADAMLRKRYAKCPVCERILNIECMTSNVPLKNVISKMSRTCEQCNQEIEFLQLKLHEQNECPNRLSNCDYVHLGCDWNGFHLDYATHKESCDFLNKSGREILLAVEKMKSSETKQLSTLHRLYKQLGCYEIFHMTLNMRANYLEVPNIVVFDTFRFTAFQRMWKLRIRFRGSTGRVLSTAVRSLGYKLTLVTRTTQSGSFRYCLIEGPNEDFTIGEHLYKFNFTQFRMSTSYKELRLFDSNASNRLLAHKKFSVRIWMFSNN